MTNLLQRADNRYRRIYHLDRAINRCKTDLARKVLFNELQRCYERDLRSCHFSTRRKIQ
jgi:hypothetical protein